MNKPKKSIQEKCKEEIPHFVEEVESLSVEQLDARLAQLAKDLESIQDQKEADDDLQKAVALVAEYRGPYTEGKRICKMKSKYLISMIKDKGGK